MGRCQSNGRPGWEQQESEPNNTLDSMTLVGEEAETKVVTVPEPTTMFPNLRLRKNLVHPR